MATQLQISRAIDNLFTTTWYDVRKTVTDQVFQIMPLHNMLFEKGNVKEKAPDGTHFEIPIQYDELNQNTQWFGKGTQFGTAEKEFLTNIQYSIKNLGTAIPRYWTDDQANRGKAKIMDYVQLKVNNTKSSLMKSLQTDSWTQNGSALSMNALPTLISTTPTSGTVAGLDRSQNSWMSNQTSNFSGKVIANDLLGEMTTIFHNCSKYTAGTRRTPDIIFTTQAIYEAFEDICNSLQQIVTTNSPRVSLGFGNLSFKGIEIYWDPNCPTGNIYFLNSEHQAL